MNQLIICACKRGAKVDKETFNQLVKQFNTQSIAYHIYEDLCGYAANNELNESSFSDFESTTIIGCQPKAMKNILERAGIDTKKHTINYLTTTNSTANDIVAEDYPQGVPKNTPYNKEWKPWYPVLDYDLCTSCQKCLNFCLFGVYILNDDGKVVVENPENCKDLCPACARTCPTNAIVFPKHHESPIDGGKGEFSLSSTNILDNIQQNQDVYQLLANRRKASGISLFKTDQLKMAQQERDQCKCKNNDN